MEPSTHTVADLVGVTEQRVSAIADALPILLAHIDEDHIYRYVNRRSEDYMGLPPSAIAGRPMWEVLGREAYESLLPYVNAALAGTSTSYDMPLPIADRGVRHLRAVYVPQVGLIEGKGGFYALVEDVTETAAVEERLRESEQRLRFTLEGANVGTWNWDLATDTVDWSENLETIHGRLPGQFAGSFESVQEDMVEEDRVAVQEAIARALEEHSDYLVHYRVVKHDGSIIWVEGRGRGQYDAEGRPIRMAGICSDITERKRAEEELRASREDLRSLNATLEARVEARTHELAHTVQELEARNRELQQFGFMAAHDLQEPLRKVVTFCDLLRSEYGDALDGDGVFYIDRMEDALRRMSMLIRDVGTFSGITSVPRPFETVDLNRIFSEVADVLRARIDDTGACLEAGSLCEVDGDPAQLRQLLFALVDNALKFGRQGVPPVVQVSTAPADRPDATEVREAYALTVKDNGIGFDPKYAERIFLPFQSIHPRGKYDGTGIGLSICRRIAERHGGTIHATGVPGEGSTFTVVLPLHH